MYAGDGRRTGRGAECGVRGTTIAGTSSTRASLRRCGRADDVEAIGPGGGIDSRGGNLRWIRPSGLGRRTDASTSHSAAPPLGDVRYGRGGAIRACVDNDGDDPTRASRELRSAKLGAGDPISPPIPRDDEGREMGRNEPLRLEGRSELNVHVERGELLALGEDGVGSRNGAGMGDGTGGGVAASDALRPVNVRIIAAPNDRVRGRVVMTGVAAEGMAGVRTGVETSAGRVSNERLAPTRNGSVGGQYGRSA